MTNEVVQMSCDPELIVLDAQFRPVPAHRFFPQKEGRRIFNYGSLFRDGYNLEINLNYEICRGLVITNWWNTLHEAFSLLPSDYKLGFLSSYKTQESDFENAPKDVLEVGCSPSSCAYTNTIRRPDYAGGLLRAAGGHIHMSVPVTHIENVLTQPENLAELVRLFDIFVGAPLAFTLEGPRAVVRRRFYGRAGEYRQTFYPKSKVPGVPSVGVEYRVPGPEMWRHPWTASLFLDLMRGCVLGFGELRKIATPQLHEAAIRSINYHNDFSWLAKLPCRKYLKTSIDMRTLMSLRAWARYRLGSVTRTNEHVRTFGDRCMWDATGWSHFLKMAL